MSPALSPLALRAAYRAADEADPIAALRRRYESARESALAFGMPRAEFNLRTASARTGDSPADWLAAGRATLDLAIRVWTRNEEEAKAERARRRAANAKSFADEAARREKRRKQAA